MEKNKKRKIFIIVLIAITVLVIAYIVYMFLGNKGNGNQGTQTRIFDFGALLAKKREPKTGSQTGQNQNPIDIGGNTDNQNTNIPGTDFNTNIPGTDFNTNIPGTNFNPNFDLKSLPNPGFNPNIPNTDPFDPNTDIVIFPPDGTVKNDPCNDPKVSGQARDIICEGPGQEVNPAPVEIVQFKLTDEEQAELDRLTRAYARLAPYLKTEADIAREQANLEAYERSVLENNRLSDLTDAERRSTSYIGPVDVVRPFINPVEFNFTIQTEFTEEILGNASFLIPNFNILGGGSSTSGSGGVFKNKKLRKSIQGVIGSKTASLPGIPNINIGDLVGELGGKMADSVIKIVTSFIEDKTNQIIDTSIGGDTRSCQLAKDSAIDYKTNKVCEKSLFEQLLKIY